MFARLLWSLVPRRVDSGVFEELEAGIREAKREYDVLVARTAALLFAEGLLEEMLVEAERGLGVLSDAVARRLAEMKARPHTHPPGEGRGAAQEARKP